MRAGRAAFWGLALAAGSAWAMNPFEKNHPLVEEGMEAYQRGDYEKALSRFEAAQKELPGSQAITFNRGNALLKLGRNEEALAAYRQVADSEKGELQQKDFYNLGTALASMGDKQGAIAAYRKALRLDPGDELSRHNLEVLLRNLPPPPSSGADGGTPDGGRSDGGADGGRSDGGTSDGGRRDGGIADGGMDGGRSDGGADGGGPADGGQDAGAPRGQDGGTSDAGQDGGRGRGDGGQDGGRDGGKEREERGDAGRAQLDGGGSDGGGAEAADGGQDAGTQLLEQRDGGAGMTRQEAEKLLDSTRNNEKNLQLWRFQQRKQRKPNDKDW